MEELDHQHPRKKKRQVGHGGCRQGQEAGALAAEGRKSRAEGSPGSLPVGEAGTEAPLPRTSPPACGQRGWGGQEKVASWSPATLVLERPAQGVLLPRGLTPWPQLHPD